MTDGQRRDSLLAAFIGACGPDGVCADEPMSAHTTFRIGGPADYFLMPPGGEALRTVIRTCEDAEIPYHIVGNGSNLLVSDKGVRGAVIRIGRQMSRIERNGDEITAEAGALLSAVAAKAQEEGLEGFVFAGGIPGSFGGACVMNAGAYGGEMKQVLKEVRCLDEAHEEIALKSEDLGLGYRSSIFMKRPCIVLSGTIALREGDKEEIARESAELKRRRQEKQPLDLPSAGSTFKRPEGYFAGKLIMDAGLRGYRVGGAQVSEKHCGFVVNTGGATADDVRKLINDVEERVFSAFQVHLEPEVRFLGEF